MFHRSALSNRWLTLIFAVVASAFPATALAAAPQLPLAYVDTSDVVPTGTMIHVSPGGSLQAALDAAQPGDVIELQAGASWRGTFHLRNKTTGSGWVTIRSSRHAELPPPGTRVSPADAPLMATLVAPGVSRAIETDEGAHHYRFVGIEITGEAIAATAQNNRFIQLDGEHSVGTTVIYQTTLEQVPHHLIFDRCYVHAGPEGGGDYIRGFVLNSAHTAIVDSHVSGFKSRGTDTQAIAGWNGPGPFAIINNYLEAAAENVMFGGAVGTLPNVVPSDIEIRSNLFKKPLTWRVGDPSYAGVPWVIKNLLEIKNAQRVLVEDNTFEDHWAQAQSGWAVVTSPRTQSGQNAWAVASDLMFRNNVFRRTTAGIYIWGHDNVATYTQSARVAFVNNLFEDLGLYVVSGAFNGVVMMLQNGIQDFTFEHNTVFNTGNILMFSHAPTDGLSTGLVIQDNIIHGGGYLISGTGTGFGVAALDAQAPGWAFDHNVITGPWPTDKGVPHTAQWIPQNNFFPNSADAVGFVDLAGGDYHLAATSLYNNAGGDGKDPGADIDTLFGVFAEDPPPPPPSLSVSITAPTSGATVSGVVTVTVSATDSVAVTSLKYYLDGALLAATSPPSFTLSWNSNSTQNGAHTLAVTASDAAGNTAQASASFTVLNLVPTTTTISAPAVTYPSNAVITVTVSSSGGTPTGTVSLVVDNGAARTGTLSNGQAQFTLTSPSVGTHTLSASYAAQGGFAASSTTGTLSSTGVVTSADTDPLYFSSASYSVSARKPTNAVITVLRSGPLDATVTVSYATSDGTAKAGRNYVAASGTLTFSPGVTKQTFKVQVKKGPAGQGPVTVNLTLSNPRGAVLGSPSKAVLTINP